MAQQRAALKAKIEMKERSEVIGGCLQGVLVSYLTVAFFLFGTSFVHSCLSLPFFRAYSLLGFFLTFNGTFSYFLCTTLASLGVILCLKTSSAVQLIVLLNSTYLVIVDCSPRAIGGKNNNNGRIDVSSFGAVRSEARVYAHEKGSSFLRSPLTA